jgi:predicted DNA-binding transcriptional regulator AlpA
MTKKPELPGLPMLNELTIEQIRQHPCSSLRHSEQPAGPPLAKRQKAKLNKKLGTGNEKEPLTISVAEFEQMSGLSHTTVYKLIREGILKSKKIGKKRLVDYQSAKEVTKAQD